MPFSSRLKTSAAPLAKERAAHATALLIVDMISAWDFPDAEALLPHAASIAPKIASLKSRCRRAGVPVVYANDNHGRWRSDFRHLTALSLERTGAGAEITRQLVPEEEDYFVLKPKQSAFFATPLHLLLTHLQARRLLITGVASDQCILSTAVDARMHDYDVLIPADCIAAHTVQRARRALAHFDDAKMGKTVRSSRIRL
jgi:nicotinamidase-related amidase